MYYGHLQFKMGNREAALAYSQKAIGLFLDRKAYRSEAEAFYLRASYFRALGQVDSCIFYARKSLSKAELISYKQYILKAATLLAETYELKNAPEALRFYKIAKLANDEVFGEKKVQELQRIVLQEIEHQQEVEKAKTAYQNRVRQYMLLAGLGVFLLIAFLLYRNNRQKQKANTVLENALSDLKSTQSQLIQSEKLASLGELTAGIAHEIQNPLNFVNNFSELSVDLAKELKEEMDNVEIPEKDRVYIGELLNDLTQNQEKINHHGKRAAAIVSGMLQHARSTSGTKEPTDINALADEYLRLAYHGFRAKDSSFNVKMETHFDPVIGEVEVIPQDIGRVLLNLINNAFYAVTQKKNQNPEDYEPTVIVSSRRIHSGLLEISVQDNGTGIPDSVKTRIFQPFFTTKPTGQGTGLGLSLAFDIITKGHGGNIEVKSAEGKRTAFIIQLPI
jgi:signal transduction histidine kinase